MPLGSAHEILQSAIEEINPQYIVSMVSGGKDSAASHAAAVELGIPIDLIIHGNTRCGIPETTEFVKKTYGSGRTEFAISDAGKAYEDYVLRKGFFGKGISAHGFSYRVLKATPFRKTISKLLRKRRRGVRILLINGARKSESANRKANLQVMRSDPGAPGNIWVNPIHHWSALERDDYLDTRSVPINPVAKLLCKSGECMCGTMQSKEQRAEASLFFPEWGRWLDELEAEAQRRHGFCWGEAFPRKKRAPKQLEMFQPMCVGCTNGDPTRKEPR